MTRWQFQWWCPCTGGCKEYDDDNDRDNDGDNADDNANIIQDVKWEWHHDLKSIPCDAPRNCYSLAEEIVSKIHVSVCTCGFAFDWAALPQMRWMVFWMLPTLQETSCHRPLPIYSPLHSKHCSHNHHHWITIFLLWYIRSLCSCIT